MNPATYFELWLLMDINWSHFSNLQKPYWFRDTWLPGNMHIYHEFERYALHLKNNGKRDRYSARAIIQRMRWDTLFADTDPEFKIVNDCTPYLARLSMLRNSCLKDMFRTQKI